MRKKIRTADEELNGVFYTMIFVLIWYVFIIRYIIANGFHSSLLIFLIGGVLPLIQGVRTVQKALYYRRFHRQCMEMSYPRRGRIVNVTREYYDTYDSDHRRHRLTYYFLIIEVVDPQTSVLQTIKSSAYRIPVHRYLGSPYVQVYTDQTGWKYVIDGFELKNKRSDPDIPLENQNVYLKDFSQPPIVFKVLFAAVLVLFFLQALGILH